MCFSALPVAERKSKRHGTLQSFLIQKPIDVGMQQWYDGSHMMLPSFQHLQPREVEARAREVRMVRRKRIVDVMDKQDC
jgi:hypothetical protein